MKYLRLPHFCYSGLLLLLVILWSSCRKDFDYAPSTGSLEFSRDTVYLDTIFSNIGSSTYSLKVYNRSSENIEIPSIGLAQGENSAYRLNVDGSAGKAFRNIPLLAKDSLFIFIETTVDISENIASFLYTDALQFDSGSNLQEVQLVTLVKDAVFIFPPTNADGSKETFVLGVDAAGNEIRVEGITLAKEQLDFTNERPYVIYGYAAVPENETLSMAPGVRVHFHNNSGIWVRPNASISVVGALSTDTLLLENEVILEGDRLEPEFSDVPGQWGGVWISKGSTDNDIDHLTLKNATIGLMVEGVQEQPTPTLTLKNSRIQNSASVNLWAKTASIVGENVILGGAGAISLYCNLGGDYSFTHTTIANYWVNGFRAGEALRIDNEVNLLSGETLQGDLINASFTNTIIDGNSFTELALSDNGTNIFNFSFTNCTLQFEGTNEDPVYDFTNTEFYTAVFLSAATDFKNAVANDFRIDSESEAIGKGNLEAALEVPFDLLGNDRTMRPDIGAFQSQIEN
ncbi:hypothetical protein FGM00_08940 [Aggregatimonas sangjinii]|uniref:Right-handed parallel beta-helix repeat-containing protein n=1 Tax=Aggregatimonas sangjinii TaxID=2583587 RepID=A0A5B7SSE0_9FLAO|nr:hypothetical protein [Aggregatimonas sangjinii]QCX00229.1 hypothetical protein FGM00_08940 [Aggregatimonas sangjinii]